MKRALIVGGSSGIGLSMAVILSGREDVEKVYIVDKAPFPEYCLTEKIDYHPFDLTASNYSIFDTFSDVDTLIVTAGFGRLALFKDIDEALISTYFNVNTLPVLRIVKHFYDKLLGKEDFYCGVMVSIAGFMSSPFFSVYGATKAALKIFIESVNVELEKAGSSNRILNVSPGSIKGTNFNNGGTDLSQLTDLGTRILSEMEQKNDLFIPQYDTVYQEVLRRYHEDFRAEGRHSYDYKLNSGRITKQKK
jgi:short-subunit dehydrogenase